MNVITHSEQALEKWRDGVMTRMRMSIRLGGRQLCIFEQYCEPGARGSAARPCRRGGIGGH